MNQIMSQIGLKHDQDHLSNTLRTQQQQLADLKTQVQSLKLE